MFLITLLRCTRKWHGLILNTTENDLVCAQLQESLVSIAEISPRDPLHLRSSAPATERWLSGSINRTKFGESQLCIAKSCTKRMFETLWLSGMFSTCFQLVQDFATIHRTIQNQRAVRCAWEKCASTGDFLFWLHQEHLTMMVLGQDLHVAYRLRTSPIWPISQSFRSFHDQKFIHIGGWSSRSSTRVLWCLWTFYLCPSYTLKKGLLLTGGWTAHVSHATEGDATGLGWPGRDSAAATAWRDTGDVSLWGWPVHDCQLRSFTSCTGKKFRKWSSIPTWTIAQILYDIIWYYIPFPGCRHSKIVLLQSPSVAGAHRGPLRRNLFFFCSIRKPDPYTTGDPPAIWNWTPGNYSTWQWTRFPSFRMFSGIPQRKAATKACNAAGLCMEREAWISDLGPARSGA